MGGVEYRSPCFRHCLLDILHMSRGHTIHDSEVFDSALSRGTVAVSRLALWETALGKTRSTIRSDKTLGPPFRDKHTRPLTL